MVCKFNKYFEEPEELYNCISTSIFISEENIRLTNKYEIVDKKEMKDDLYYINLVETERKINEGEYPSNLYLRLYYDKTIKGIKRYDKINLVILIIIILSKFETAKITLIL